MKVYNLLIKKFKKTILHRESIVHGESGLIVPPKDTNLFYHAMKQILFDSAGREKMAVSARHLIVSRFEKSLYRGA